MDEFADDSRGFEEAVEGGCCKGCCRLAIGWEAWKGLRLGKSDELGRQ